MTADDATTREQARARVLAMEAGEALDRLVAERIFGVVDQAMGVER